MTYAPATLTALASYWTAQGGVNLGVVGDTAHQAKGTSYHLGRDQLAPGAYSAQTARDVAGLSNAASAIDLGRLDGTLANLQHFSRWLVRQCQANATGTRDIREIIYSPDGTIVLRYDRERGYDSAPRPGEASDTHRTHTHISAYRDSEYRDKRPIFRPYFEDDTVTTITILPWGGVYVIPANTTVTGFTLTATGAIGERKTWAARPDTSSAHYDADMTTTSTRGGPFLRCTDGFFAGFYIPASQVVEKPLQPPAPDCTAEAEAALALGKVEGAAAERARWTAWLATAP